MFPQLTTMQARPAMNQMNSSYTPPLHAQKSAVIHKKSTTSTTYTHTGQIMLLITHVHHVIFYIFYSRTIIAGVSSLRFQV